MFATHAADAFNVRRDKEKQRKASPSSGGWDLCRSENVGSVLQLGLLELVPVCRDQWSSKLNRRVQFLRSSISGEILLENGPQPAVHGLVLVRGPFGSRPHRKNKYLYFILFIISSWMMFHFEKFPVPLYYMTGCLLSYLENTTYHSLLLHLSTAP